MLGILLLGIRVVRWWLSIKKFAICNVQQIKSMMNVRSYRGGNGWRGYEPHVGLVGVVMDHRHSGTGRGGERLRGLCLRSFSPGSRRLRGRGPAVS